ncbi:hypothetical protein [Massilia sp. BJB1822]|uniref:hypothetical protein n=1 Tax=Massilia sp. BJB1822 TaxID=2744470 RepID=UPI0015942B15|nr:hypothetical protein [Massilia sp. BJB1822]NVD97467.1 hypothetical protein [Massilia sp. BJB1822]
MVKKTFNFELGNRGLFPSEHNAVRIAKLKLMASAVRHGSKIEASALFQSQSDAPANGAVNGVAATASPAIQAAPLGSKPI